MSENMEDLKHSRNYQRERVKQVKIARNRNADGLAYWRERAMAMETALREHCDKRIADATRAINREEKYLYKLLRSKSAGGVMAGDIEGAFHRLRTALEPKRS